MKQLTILSAALAFLSPSVGAYDDLTVLSDEFDISHPVTNWQRIYEIEGWGNDVVQQFDINTSRPGRMTMVPYTSSWYVEWRGELTFKTVTGDFVTTTDVKPRNRAGTGALPVSKPMVLTNGLRLPNSTVVNGCNPDLVAAFDYVRYARPVVPANLTGTNFSNAGTVSDAQLLSVLGDNANVPGGAAVAPVLSTPAFFQRKDSVSP